MGSKKKKRKTGKEKFKEFLDAFTWGTGAMVVFSLGFFFVNEPDPDFSLPDALLCSLGMGLLVGLFATFQGGGKSRRGGSTSGGGGNCGGCGGGGCGGGG